MTLDKEIIKNLITKASRVELELVWIPKIMARQTLAEVDAHTTIEYNGVGLNGRDAPFITGLYMRIQNGAHLSVKQVSAVRRVLLKYARQYSEMTVGV